MSVGPYFVTADANTDGSVRPLDELLAAYGSGSLDPARHALVASHLALKTDNRRFVRAVEDFAASEFLMSETSGSAHRRDERLAAIFGLDDEENAGEQRPAAAARDGGLLPAPLRHYLGCDLDDLGWRFVVPGVREVKVGDCERGEASLIHVRAGRRLPRHTHEGSEITLVLTGAFHDPQGRYIRGDIAIADSSLEHSPEIERDADCICFAVTDAPLRLTSPVGRLVEKILSLRH
jgi:putative transcriptional regulator